MLSFRYKPEGGKCPPEVPSRNAPARNIAKPSRELRTANCGEVIQLPLLRSCNNKIVLLIKFFPLTSIMNSLQLIELNNNAVAALQQGKSKQAIESLRVALANLKHHFHALKEHEPQAPVPTPSCGTPWPPLRDLPRVISDASIATQSELYASTSSLSLNDEATQGMDIDESEDLPSVFSVPVDPKTTSQCPTTEDDALVFMYTGALVLYPDVDDRELITGVVLYNMALVNHRRALKKGTTSLLAIALKLYGMAASLMADRNNSDEIEGLLLLAVYNNMAQIHSTSCSSLEMSHCLDKIRCLLADISDDSLIDEDDYTFFFMNSSLQVEELTLAPAA